MLTLNIEHFIRFLVHNNDNSIIIYTIINVNAETRGACDGGLNPFWEKALAVKIIAISKLPVVVAIPCAGHVNLWTSHDERCRDATQHDKGGPD